MTRKHDPSGHNRTQSTTDSHFLGLMITSSKGKVSRRRNFDVIAFRRSFSIILQALSKEKRKKKRFIQSMTILQKKKVSNTKGVIRSRVVPGKVCPQLQFKRPLQISAEHQGHRNTRKHRRRIQTHTQTHTHTQAYMYIWVSFCRAETRCKLCL